MVSGGARTRSGPPPDPNALRRDRDSGEWIELPKAGREGPPPQWPLPDLLSGELEAWAREWRRPQAIVWERQGQELEVALFVRAVFVAEGPKATAADRNVVQRKMNDLGLTTPGLRANRWKIVDDAAPAAAATPAQRGSGARARLAVIDGEVG